MAAIPVVLNGVFTTDTGSSTGVFQGTMAYSDRAPGGGPIEPGNPPGIWGGGNVPMPTPPIANVPGAPGYRPPGDHIWGGPIDPSPGHPLPQPPIDPPTEPPTNPPNPAWVWGWSPKIPPSGGWTPVYVPGPGEAGPKG